MTTTTPNGSRPLGVVSAAVALACSWCWVIGMVFPIFMIADFGWPGWVVFVVPNVIGAASVGFLLRSRAHAEGFLETHRHAVRAFSWVTCIFHVFVLAHLVPGMQVLTGVREIFGGATSDLVLILGLTAVLSFFAWRFARRDSIATIARDAWVVLVLSAVLLLLAPQARGTGGYHMPSFSHEFPRWMALFALAGTSLGFLTCPFLDVTFLRIRSGLDDPKRARAAFALGFCVPFLALVTMTGLYASSFFFRRHGASFYFYDFIVGHILVQSVFTIGFHAWATRRIPKPNRTDVWLVPISIVVGLLLFGGQEVKEFFSPTGFPFRFGYELLISAYALPFPAYVWIVCVWAKRPTRRSLTVCAIAIVLAGPLFWIGYLGDRWEFVPLGVAVVLASPALLFVGKRGAKSGGGSGRRLASN